MIIVNILLLILGLALLIKGADFFVDGAASIAKAMKIPSLIIGLTLVSIGTSAPELSVSITSALGKANDICFGNVIGSNIFNTFVVIGASALFVPLTLGRDMKYFDIPILAVIYVILGLFSFVITPGKLDAWEGIIFILLFAAYMIFLVLRTKKEGIPEEEEETDGKKRRWYMDLLFIVLGLVMIIWGGDLTVDNASELAKACGMSELLVGLTIVAIGTSLPELVTSVVAARKGEHDMAIGNAIGSSIFNVLLILGASAVIYPLSVELSGIVDTVVLLVSAAMVWLFAAKTNKITKVQGVLLIAVYIVYMAYAIVRGLS